MKKSLLLLTLAVFVFAGCAASNPSLANDSKVKEGMTSKQVEKAINWKYCKESM